MSAVVQALLMAGASAAVTMPPFSGSRGLFAGGDTGSASVSGCKYITIATTSNSSDFGTQPATLRDSAGASNGTRCLFAGGYTYPTSPGYQSRIDYFVAATTGNSTLFGSLSGNKGLIGGCSDGTTGLFGGGTNGSTYQNATEKVTIATTGNAVAGPNLTGTIAYISACASTARGIFHGGYKYTGSYANTNEIQYFTFASLATATSFGNLSAAARDNASASDNSKALIALGMTTAATAAIEYITIATTGNSASWGNLSAARNQVAGCANATRAVFGGGLESGSKVATIEYNDFSSASNSTNFGNLRWSGSNQAVGDTAAASGA